jgi:hypothetical protein
MATRQAISRARRTAFLAALEKGFSVTAAAAAAGVNRTLLYKWRTRSPAFTAAWNDAVMTAIDLLEDEALRRAVYGVERPVFYRGKQVGAVTTYSDRLLMLLLQRHDARLQRINRPMPLPPAADPAPAPDARGEEKVLRRARDDRTSDKREPVSACLPVPAVIPSEAGNPSSARDRGVSERRESVCLCLPAPDRRIPRAAVGTMAFQGRVNLSPSVSLSPAVTAGAARTFFGARGGGVSDPRGSVSFCPSVPDCQVSRIAIQAVAFRDRANLSPTVSLSPRSFRA